MKCTITLIEATSAKEGKKLNHQVNIFSEGKELLGEGRRHKIGYQQDVSVIAWKKSETLIAT